VIARSITEALLLRSTPFGESDAVVTLFTREHGKLSALARGARASKRRFAGALGLLVLSNVDVKRRPRGDLWSLEGAEIAREWTALAGDVAAVAHASYAVEIVRELVPPEQPEPRLLDMLIEQHEALAEVGPSAAVLRALELGVLDALGHAPVLDACAACGRPDALDRGAVVFDAARGGVLCAACASTSRGAGVRPLPAGARAYLLAARAVPRLADAAALEAGTDEHDRAAARDAVVGMITGLVGRPLRSIEFITKLRSV
jgi:DNA repair protein RecO (recombination protein O)